MALTDHSQGLGVANGLTPERLAAQREVLRQLQDRYDIRILAGSEVDIRADGRMDFSGEVLAELDVVVASVHNAMSQDRDTMTRRIISAMEHPSVTIIGHLSTRLLGQRPPSDFDLEAVLQTARDTGTALEINASPARLDLRDTHAYRARELGVPLVINTDSAPPLRAVRGPVRRSRGPSRLVRAATHPERPPAGRFYAVHHHAQAGQDKVIRCCRSRWNLLMPPRNFDQSPSGSGVAVIDPRADESESRQTAPDAAAYFRQQLAAGAPLAPGVAGGHGPVDAAQRDLAGEALQVHRGPRGFRLAAPRRAPLCRGW